MALAITPQGDFGDLPNLQGFKARCETLARAGPHSRRKSLATGVGILKLNKYGNVCSTLASCLSLYAEKFATI